MNARLCDASWVPAAGGPGYGCALPMGHEGDHQSTPSRDLDQRQALFNAATVIARVARRWNRHPATRAVMLRVADGLHAEAIALLNDTG